MLILFVPGRPYTIESEILGRNEKLLFNGSFTWCIIFYKHFVRSWYPQDQVSQLKGK